jgi:cytochrome c oxidase cbb3-type subunit IV
MSADMNIEYQMLRTFADSWGLLFMTLVFVLVIFRALRPSARRYYDDAASIPFKEDN